MKVQIRQEEETLVADLAGDWEMKSPTPRFDSLIDEVPDGAAVGAIAFEADELGEWDSSLLTFLLQGMTYRRGKHLPAAAAAER